MTREELKPHERVIKHFESVINEFVDDIINQNYLTEEYLKVKIRACVVNSIKTSSKKGHIDSKLIFANEKSEAKHRQISLQQKEIVFLRKQIVSDLDENETEKFYRTLDQFNI